MCFGSDLKKSKKVLVDHYGPGHDVTRAARNLGDEHLVGVRQDTLGPLVEVGLNVWNAVSGGGRWRLMTGTAMPNKLT